MSSKESHLRRADRGVRLPRPAPSPRAARALSVLLVAGAVGGLSGCGNSAADLPIVAPTTTGTLTMTTAPDGGSGSATGTATGSGTETGSGTATSGAKLSERAFTIVGIGRAFRGLTVMGKKSVEDPPQGDGGIGLCPGGPTIAVPAPPDDIWQVLQWKGTDSLLELRVQRREEVAQARTAAEAVIAAAAACPATLTADGHTYTVTRQKKDVVEGMPYGRVVLRDGAAGTTTFRGLLVMGNVIAAVSSTAPVEADATSAGTQLLSNLAAQLERL